jgi:hypothetical protein
MMPKPPGDLIGIYLRGAARPILTPYNFWRTYFPQMILRPLS